MVTIWAEVITMNVLVQQLLGPIVSQILVDAPLDLASAEDEYEKIATVEEMDDTLVSCVSRMALTAGSDLFWKPLNREVCIIFLYMHY